MRERGINTSTEWDHNASARHQQIVSGIDISYTRILVPTVLVLLEDIRGKSILDVGCGSGILTASLAQTAKLVIGVDPSSSMIRIAHQEYGGVSNLRFISMTIEKYAQEAGGQKFDICVSNMALMAMPKLDEAISAIGRILQPGAIMVITITHPWFWNQYRQLEDPDQFDYLTPHVQSGPFVVSLDKTPLSAQTKLFHRPLQAYFESFYHNHLHIERLLEPFPPPEVEKLYPHPWQFPRFLALKCRYEPNPMQGGS